MRPLSSYRLRLSGKFLFQRKQTLSSFFRRLQVRRWILEERRIVRALSDDPVSMSGRLPPESQSTVREQLRKVSLRKVLRETRSRVHPPLSGGPLRVPEKFTQKSRRALFDSVRRLFVRRWIRQPALP
mmetsp:Transcript_36141/g.84478  ORF Transcript_36141/g.84478 Transcript_36141/m.84478 type:complete len:128 (-) Transcript_36141:335-718(-)